MAKDRGAVYIDARQPASGWGLWGMNLVERQLRQAALGGFSRARIWVSPASRQEVLRLRGDLESLYPFQLEVLPAPDQAALSESLAQAAEPVLLLQGDLVGDDRLISHLVKAGPGAALAEGEAALAYLSPQQARGLASHWGEEVSLAGALAAAGLKPRRPAELDPYVPSLRLTMPPYLRRVRRPEELRALDHLLYHRTFKEVIDAIARYGYYHLVRWTTRQLSRTALPPNLFTGLSILAIWAAIPCFALGELGVGALCAWLGVILDSVDGKLARLTLHLSEGMGRLEHLSATPGLGLWFLALGWHCSGGELLSDTPMALATWALLGAFVLDKVVSATFAKRQGRELFDYRPLDAAFHLVAARRNVSLLQLSAGALLGEPHLALVLMAAWMLCTLAFHAGRWAWAELAPTAS
ncbi:MAG: CDP-alcohol phosphatidyltransferase family protein [Candidatus Handelsmanbacteria bacterium]|nr:CDP-alcohol phosphatidyltransferase family protein [Candidatus Handelsmanbacteria bacterium]